MSRNIRWDDCLLKNVLSLVEALLELSEQQEDNSKPTLWVEWREDKLRVTGYETKQKAGKRSRTDEVGTKKKHLLNLIQTTSKSSKLPSEIKKLDEIQYVLDCLRELKVQKDEESNKNHGYWKFSLKLKHQTATTAENLEVVECKWKEHPKTKSQKTSQKSTTTDNGIDWRKIFHQTLKEQLKKYVRHNATERGFEVNVHVPLGLLERKQQQRRDKHSAPENPYELEKEVIVKTYEHDAFLQEVIGEQSTEKKKHIGIIGEAGAGKTTLLSKVAKYLKDETAYLPIWISLANLQGETLENYLLETWLARTKCSKTTKQFKER